jgi:hypothetical protein
MRAVPATRPETIPDVLLMEAVDGLLELQLPPGVALASVVVPPMQADGVPIIAAGSGLTVMVVDRSQPAADVYVIDAVPAFAPFTKPEAEPIVATDTSPLVHVPPVSELFNVVAEPSHTLLLPVIAGGIGLTVTTVFTAQPVGSM